MYFITNETDLNIQLDKYPIIFKNFSNVFNNKNETKLYDISKTKPFIFLHLIFNKNIKEKFLIKLKKNDDEILEGTIFTTKESRIYEIHEQQIMSYLEKELYFFYWRIKNN